MDMPTDIQHQQMGYDRTATMFTPEGHLLQVEYAEKTVRLGSSSLAMICKDGVFILADKRINDSLIVPASTQKVYEIDSHLITSVAGIVSDARVLIDKAQVLAQQNRITYDTSIEPELIIKEISNLKQQFTQHGGARPFGASLMIAGVQNGKAQLYTSDITGNYIEYFANAIGENDSKIKEMLREKYKQTFTMKQGVDLALEIMKNVQEDKFDISRFELAYLENKKEGITRLEGKGIEELN